MLSTLGLSHNLSLLNDMLFLTLSEPQVLPALVCFCDAGGKEKGAEDKRHDPTVNKGSLHLISQAGSQSQGGYKVICEERETKEASL